MSSEFDRTEDFELDDLNAELEALAELDLDIADEDEFVEATMRTAVLQKNNMVALLCLKSAVGGAAICRVDPREEQPAVQLYDDPAAALKWYRRSLRSSRNNGWNVVYDGLPLQG